MYYRDILKILKHISDHIFYPGNIIRVLFYHVFTVVIPCPHFDVRDRIKTLMPRIKALDEPREGQKAFEAFDMAIYSKSVFGMFTDEETTVTLEVENHMAGVIIDRFGKDISLAPVCDTHFHATVNVIASPSSSAGS